MSQDWSKLGFEYMPVHSHGEARRRGATRGGGGRGGGGRGSLPVGATVLHYGQAVFEGLKAFRRRDGGVYLFRPEENARRLAESARRLMIPEVPEELFLKAVKETVTANLEYVPPFETGGSLYIRPVVFGSGSGVGLKPSSEYLFLVIVTPVGDYYSAGLKAVSAMIMDEFDRSAPLGLGAYKVAGNYAGALLPNDLALKQGHPITLFLDPIQHRYVEEFNSSNFVAITKEGTFITPRFSQSILRSITNKSLMALAKAVGMTVEQRDIDFEQEVESFAEVGAVGTAVIITPINRILWRGKLYTVGPDTLGPKLTVLYEKLKAIRAGDEEDKLGWMVPV